MDSSRPGQVGGDNIEKTQSSLTIAQSTAVDDVNTIIQDWTVEEERSAKRKYANF